MKLNNVNHFSCSRKILEPQDNTITNLEKFDLEFQKACDEKNYAKLIELSENHISQIHLETINKCLFDALEHDENDLVEFLLTKKIADIYACKPNDKNLILHNACRLGNTRIVKLLLSMGANIETPGNGNLTPLLHAIYNGSSDIVQILIENKADTSASNLINCAFHAQNHEAVRLLLNKRMNLNNPFGETPYSLFVALCSYPISKRQVEKETSHVLRDPTTISASNRNELLNILKENGLLQFDPISIETENALVTACSVNYDDVFEYLHQNGFDFSKLPEKIALKLFSVAIENKSHEVLKKLIKLGLDVNCQDIDGTPLHLACIGNDQDAIRILLDANAKKYIPDCRNHTSFDFALHKVDNEEIIQEFMQDEFLFETFKLSSKSGFLPSPKNLKILIDNDFFHDNPLELLLFFNDFEENQSDKYNHLFLEALRKYPEYKKLLLDTNNIALAEKLSEKESILPFKIACAEKDYVALELFAKHDISSIPTEAVNSCLFEALKKNEDDLVEFLLLNSLVDVNASIPTTEVEKKLTESDSEDSILDVACRYGNFKIVNLLLSLGADIENTGPRAYDALESAIHSGNIDIVKLLIDSGAKTNSSELIEIAFVSQNPKALRLLLEHGADLNIPTEKNIPFLSFLCSFPILNKQLHKTLDNCPPDPTTLGAESRKELLDILKAHGKLEFDYSSEEFYSALGILGSSNYEDVIDYLSKNCFDLSSLPEYPITSLLFHVLEYDSSRILKKMIDLGFDVNYLLENKNSLLHDACRSRAKNSIEFLLQAGAKKDTLNTDGMTPFDIALHRVNDPTIIKKFMQDTSVLESFKCISFITLLYFISSRIFITPDSVLISYPASKAWAVSRQRPPKIFIFLSVL